MFPPMSSGVARRAGSILLALVASATAQPQLTVNSGLTLIDSEDTFDLGDVLVGDAVGVALTVRNTGDETLVFDQPPVALGEAATGTIGLFEGSLPDALNDIPARGFGVLPAPPCPRRIAQSQGAGAIQW